MAPLPSLSIVQPVVQVQVIVQAPAHAPAPSLVQAQLPDRVLDPIVKIDKDYSNERKERKKLIKAEIDRELSLKKM